MAHQIPPPRRPGRGSNRDRGLGSSAGQHSAPDPNAARQPDPTLALPLGTPPASLAPGPGRAPFAWQHGNRLLLLEGWSHGWVLAELRFDPAACHYVEVRRTRYRWAREAAGSLLSRVLAAGDATCERTARDLAAWLDAAASSQ